MRIDNAFYYELPMTLDEVYIRSIFDALDIKKIYIKEVAKMEFDIEKMKEYYADLLAKRDEAVAIALANKDAVIAERFEQAKAKIAEEVEAEIIKSANAPFEHDIALCEKFIVADEVEEQPAEEAVAVEEVF